MQLLDRDTQAVARVRRLPVRLEEHGHRGGRLVPVKRAGGRCEEVMLKSMAIAAAVSYKSLELPCARRPANIDVSFAHARAAFGFGALGRRPPRRGEP